MAVLRTLWWRAATPGVLDPLLVGLLERTSRSFFLSLRFLPPETREQISLTYLLARLADSVADGSCVARADAPAWLGAFRDALQEEAAVAGPPAAPGLSPAGAAGSEADLVRHAARVLAAFARLSPGDRALSRQVLEILVDGMRLDLVRFHEGTIGRIHALETLEELERYCYTAAGCVGEYWTRVHAAHLPALAPLGPALTPLGIRFGLGLQLVNVLRDLPADLRRGRCYLPRTELEAAGLTPAALLDPRSFAALRGLFLRLAATARGHLEAGWAYVRLLPRSMPRLRLCCAWPLFFGLRTLGLLSRVRNPLDPFVVPRIARGRVYWVMAETLARAPAPALLDRMWARELAAAESAHPAPRRLQG